MKDSFILEAFGHISSSLAIEQSLERAYHYLKGKIPADGAFIDIYLEPLHQIRFLALVEDGVGKRFNKSIKLSPAMELSLKHLDRPKIKCTDDIEADAVTWRVAEQVGFDIRSFIILRLELENQHLGVVSFFSKKYAAFSQAHCDFLAQLHNPFALVTANAIYPILKAENISLHKKNRKLQSQLTKVFNSPLEDFLRTTPSLEPVAQKMARVAAYDTTVLILGETGSGKEVVANIIHQISDRSGKPFIKVNCGAIPETLLDSELFGHEKGAFTDAKNTHLGYFEQANGGTLFLDEVAELPLSAQVRLLRVLQHKTITRVGGNRSITLDVRIIAATHKLLENLVSGGEFRDDLWYRLNVFPIHIPPLRKRTQDILPLTIHIFKKIQAKYKLAYLPHLSEKSIQQALSYDWRGNVRELENMLERSVLQSNQKTITLALPERVNDPVEPLQPRGSNVLASRKTSEAIEPFDKMMREYLLNVLEVCNWKISGKGGAAEKLGLHPNTLRSRLQKLNLLPLRHERV